MPYIPPVTSPNIDKLLSYLNKSQWHNVSAHFSNYVRREYDNLMDRLGDDDVYKHLRLMIEYSEMGRFSEARTLIDDANKEHQDLINRLTEMNLNQNRNSPRRYQQREPVDHHDSYTRRDAYTPERRDIATPPRRPSNPRADPSPRGNAGYETPKRHEEMQDRPPRTPQYQQDQGMHYDVHKQNYENLRLRPPEQHMKHDSPRHKSHEEHGSRPNSHRGGRQTPPSSGVLTSASQMTSSKALWGRDFGDKPSEKVGSSTYRQDFPTYSMDQHERKDKERYRENFGSLAERDLYRDSDAGSNHGDVRRSAQPRNIETPDPDNRPLDLGKKFRELYSHEWTDAYDEICKEFGSEKTVRHLLWIVTECSLIANDVADHQLRTLEKKAFGVMTTPGDLDEAWLIAGDVAFEQLKDLEKTAIRLMKTPNKENIWMTPTPTPTPSPMSSNTSGNHGGGMPRQLGDMLPSSRTLLVKYRKQTALLSIPYVKEECRDKISKTLIESSGFSKSYLGDASRLTAYINKCAELTWLMCVQDPPIFLEYITKETEGARFNTDHYHVYTKHGNTYDYGVWPMLRIGKKGQILAKGIAQGI